MKITYEKLKIINALKEGPKTWTELRNIYYADKGIERLNSKASTSFYNQLKRMQEANLVVKEGKGYILGDATKCCPHHYNNPQSERGCGE